MDELSSTNLTQNLTQQQTQRCLCLQLAFEQCAGRSVPWANVWAIARWLYCGEVAP